ncbi:unnamed protein product [Pleuronectes platessa]|uniref:Uncharacterized protein n=1 Tax=Pleuronectes platessa TaxID=8262 RepID=A0A9N7VWV2_PLEPL|nr:unnamed protein product [Pleuronectes platessa]
MESGCLLGTLRLPGMLHQKEDPGETQNRLERGMEDCRWDERGIGWEIHVGDYGWRLIVGSVAGGIGGCGMGYLMDVKKMRWKQNRALGQEKMTGSIDIKSPPVEI